MTISRDLLDAFIDGKLSPDEASSVAAKLADDPELAAYVEHQKALKAALAAPAMVRLRHWKGLMESSSPA